MTIAGATMFAQNPPARGRRGSPPPPSPLGQPLPAADLFNALNANMVTSQSIVSGPTYGAIRRDRAAEDRTAERHSASKNAPQDKTLHHRGHRGHGGAILLW